MSGSQRLLPRRWAPLEEVAAVWEASQGHYARISGGSSYQVRNGQWVRELTHHPYRDYGAK
jgi:hypothetical protein